MIILIASVYYLCPCNSFSLYQIAYHLIRSTKTQCSRRLKKSSRREEQDKLMTMAMILSKLSRQASLPMTVMAAGVGRVRGFAAGGGKAKKGSKGGGEAPKVSTISIEVKASTVVGANILKDGVDPKVLPDGEYPEWLWRLLDKRPPLSELQRRKVESLPYEELRRFVKLDNRARIKEGNAVRAKN